MENARSLWRTYNSLTGLDKVEISTKIFLRR